MVIFLTLAFTLQQKTEYWEAKPCPEYDNSKYISSFEVWLVSNRPVQGTDTKITTSTTPVRNFFVSYMHMKSKFMNAPIHEGNIEVNTFY